MTPYASYVATAIVLCRLRLVVFSLVMGGNSSRVLFKQGC